MKFVEAVIVMPLTIMITIAMITITVGMYQNLRLQVANHQEELKVVYESSEALEVRIWDAAKNLIK